MRGLGGWEEGQGEVSVSTGDDWGRGTMWARAEIFTLADILIVIMIIIMISVNVC